jgi:hypothetical protein
VAIPLTTFLIAYGSNRILTIYARANGVGNPLERRPKKLVEYAIW